jgi:ribosomal protein S18 acetylase RimI-like enzyme
MSIVRPIMRPPVSVARALPWRHVELRTVPYDHPDAARLVGEVQQEYVRRYGGQDTTPTDPAEFAPPQGLFVVGYVDGWPAVCGGWRIHDGDEPHFADGDAEIKRMYVTPSQRGRGLARALLAELERTAVDAGRRRMVLETGYAQPEAIGLYLSCGYSEITKFGQYRDSAGSVCYGKQLRPYRLSPGVFAARGRPDGVAG